MFLLLFFIILIQFFIYWIFGPATLFLTSIVEVKNLPALALIALIFLFSYEK